MIADAAARRGLYLQKLTDAVCSRLFADGHAITDGTRAAIFHALADEMFDGALIDVPDLRRPAYQPESKPPLKPWPIT